MKPDAGVTAASPAMAPVARPRALGLPCCAHSMAIQVSAATEAEMWVTVMAIAAFPLAARALPPLNPNHPTQSIAVPVTVMVMLWGNIGVVGYPERAPMTMQATRAATPAVMWTTTPPAKSNTPISPRKPPPHTQWQTGA
jgi:hypothetical protein